MNFSKAEFILSAVEPSKFLRDGLPQIAFAGRSNVGKSSVINRLLGRKNFAHVAPRPVKHPRLIILSWTARHIWWICRVTVMPRYPRRSATVGEN